MNDAIIKHLTAIVARLVQIYCEVNDCDHLGIQDVTQAAEGLQRMGFDLDSDTLNSIVSRAVGVLAMNNVVIEFV